MPKKGKKKTARGRKASQPLSRSLRVYQKVAIIFVVVSLLLLLGVLYLSVSQAVIRIVPNSQVVSANVAVEITPNPNALGQATGFVLEENFEKARTFQVSSDGGTPIESKAGGTVTLINETGTQYDLVGTTRVLSEEGILFRLDNAVVIPANGQVEAAVSADQPGLSGEIGPSQFTIPGLPASVQDVVYAVSVDSMTGGVEYARVLTQADLDAAADELGEEVLEESKDVLRSRVNAETFNGEVFMVEVVEKISDAEPGAEQGSFNLSVVAQVTAVFYDRQLIEDHVVAELYESAPTGYELVTVNMEGLQVEVQNVSISTETAQLSAYVDGVAAISTGSETLHVDRFLGRSPQEVETLLEASDAIEDVSVNFTPFWLKRIPSLQDHIKIIIEPIE